MNKVNEKIDFRAEVEKIARDNNISVEYVSNDYNAFNIVRVLISWGDWKHEHARLDYLVAEKMNVINKRVEVIEEDGSDCYSAIHVYRFEKE